MADDERSTNGTDGSVTAGGSQDTESSFWTTGRTVGFSAASAVVLAGFLPWINAPIVGSVYGYKGDGRFTIAAGVLALLIAVAAGTDSIGSTVEKYGFIVTGLVSLGIPAYMYVNLQRMLPSSGGEHSSELGRKMAEALSSSVGPGIGSILTVAGGIGLIVGGFLTSD